MKKWDLQLVTWPLVAVKTCTWQSREEVTWPIWDPISSSRRVIPGRFSRLRKRTDRRDVHHTTQTLTKYNYVKLHFSVEFPFKISNSFLTWQWSFNFDHDETVRKFEILISPSAPGDKVGAKNSSAGAEREIQTKAQQAPRESLLESWLL